MSNLLKQDKPEWIRGYFLLYVVLLPIIIINYIKCVPIFMGELPQNTILQCFLCILILILTSYFAYIIIFNKKIWGIIIILLPNLFIFPFYILILGIDIIQGTVMEGGLRVIIQFLYVILTLLIILYSLKQMTCYIVKRFRNKGIIGLMTIIVVIIMIMIVLVKDSINSGRNYIECMANCLPFITTSTIVIIAISIQIINIKRGEKINNI